MFIIKNYMSFFSVKDSIMLNVTLMLLLHLI